MKQIIFKSEKKAKKYEIRASKDYGVYRQGELIRTVITDNIDELIGGEWHGLATAKVIG